MHASLLRTWADLLLVTENEIKLTIYMLACYPLSMIFVALFHEKRHSWITARLGPRIMESSLLKSLYLILFGCLFLYYIFGLDGIAGMLVCALPIYLLVSQLWALRGKQMLSPWEAWLLRWGSFIGFAWSLGQVASYHIYRVSFHLAQQFDVSLLMMLLTLKTTSLVNDAVDAVNDHPYRLSHRKLTEKPGFFEYLAFVFAFNGLVTGPVSSFHDFRAFLNCHSLDADTRRTQFYSGLGQGIFSVGYIALWCFLVRYFYVDYYWLPSVQNASVLKRVLFAHAIAITCRLRFYFAWGLAEGAFIVSGMKFPNRRNVYPLKIETSPDLKQVTTFWNVSVSRWLHDDVYIRVAASEQARHSLMPNLITFSVSAFWHGFLPGYYMTFVSGAVFSVAEKMFWKKRLRSFWVPLQAEVRPGYVQTQLMEAIANPAESLKSAASSKPVDFGRSCLYWSLRTLRTVVFQAILTYVALPFVFLEFSKGFAFWQSTYFFGHVLLFFMYLISL